MRAVRDDLIHSDVLRARPLVVYGDEPTDGPVADGRMQPT